MNILLSKQKIKELMKQLSEFEESLSTQQTENVKSGGALNSWHETASFAATQDALKANVRKLRSILTTAKVLPDKVSSNKVTLGSWVTIEDSNQKQIKYRLVHPLEADPFNNLISIKSPIGKELSGKRVGEQVELNGNILRITKLE